MYRQLFRSRWIALAFVLMMVASAINLVGTESSDGVIDQTAAQLMDQKQQFEAKTSELAQPTRSHQIVTLDEPVPEDEEIGDESLIDPATGIDPTPPETAGFEPEPDLDPTPVE